MMRTFTALFLALILAVGLNGCGFEEDSYRTDTVIYIPAEPTEPETEPTTEITEAEETEITETAAAETTEEAVPEVTEAASPKKTSSGSSGSGKKTSSASNPATEPPVTASTEATTEATTVPAETAPPLYDISGYCVGSLETAMMDQINSLRVAEGLGELGKNSRLCAIASARAYEASQSWSHTRPDGTYFTTVFQDYGFSCGGSAENLIHTSGGEDAATLVARWMESDGNRSNLMSSGFSVIGIGVYCANGITYIACLLAG